MKRDSDRCPDPEVLAAFVAGSLTGAELEMVADHVLECEDCRIVIADAAQYDRTNAMPATNVVQHRPRRPWWLAAAAAAIIGVTALSYWRTRSPQPNHWIATLADRSPRSARYVEPRLSGGFPWAPLAPTQRGTNEKLDPSQMKLVGVAADVLEETAEDTSAEARHARGVASLLGGDAREAVASLSQAASSTKDALMWSDLAAAQYVAAIESEDPQQFAQALGAVDASLRIKPHLPEALFNRALILEQLGLREQARAAWERFLAADTDNPWRREAQSHLARLKPVASFKAELERQYELVSSDREAATALTARFPQEARIWGESEILDRWARCAISGDGAVATRHLRLAQFFGDALAERQGERLLQDAVRAILSSDGSRRRTLALAHIDFREAQKTYKASRPAEAGMRFQSAAEKFAIANSPMESVSRYFAANTAYDQQKIDEARSQLESLLAATPHRYRALAAQIRWELGLVYAARGRWGPAMRTLRESIAAFDSLGETRYAMTVRELLAQVYDRLGEPREAWSHRVVALRDLGQQDDVRLRATFHAIARGAALSREWPVTLSFLSLQTEGKRQAGDEMMYVNALLTKARIGEQTGDRPGALTDYARAKTAMSLLTDPTLARRAESERLATQACLASSPTQAISLFTSAIDFHRAQGSRMLLPEMLLRRGRAYTANGSRDRAAQDFDDGIRELEAQRASIANEDERWGIFVAANELFDEAAALALQRRDDAAALAYCDRSRGRELLDSLGPDVPANAQARGPGGAVILSYLLLPQRLVIFIRDEKGTRAIEREVAAKTIETEVAALTESAQTVNTDAFRQMSSRLYERLVAPVDNQLQAGRTLIFIPDDTLAVVPFGALLDRSGRYLIERGEVTVAPSVTAFELLCARSARESHPATRLLLITGPSAQDGDKTRLVALQREADAVAAAYTFTEKFSPIGDWAHLEQRAASADVIHFVGHARMPDGTRGAALVTSRSAGLDGQLDIHDIAAMNLRQTRVVVLAACGTARLHGRTGEKSISLARAFLAAGAPAVIATLWPIDDAQAAEFFPRIHHYLARGVPPAQALRSAQLEWVHRRDTPPGVWAAVQIIGS